MESLDPTMILSREEVMAVIQDLRRRAKRSISSRMNLAIFRLSACCGLRCKEIQGIEADDFILGGARPILRVRKAITKGREDQRKARKVPLWWDKGTYSDLAAWLDEARRNTGLSNPLVIHNLREGSIGKQLCRRVVAARWTTAIRVLGPDRVKQLSIHKGRHTFISHALHAGHSLPAVRDAAGHASINRTSIYLHAINDDKVPDIFSEE